MADERKIKKIKLSDGSVYSIFDAGAARIDPTTHKLLTGNTVVDQLVLGGDLFILEIDERNVAVDNVLTWESSTGEIQQRDADKLLEDIGGYSCNVADSTLSLKLGK